MIDIVIIIILLFFSLLSFSVLDGLLLDSKIFQSPKNMKHTKKSKKKKKSKSSGIIILIIMLLLLLSLFTSLRFSVLDGLLLDSKNFLSPKDNMKHTKKSEKKTQVQRLLHRSLSGEDLGLIKNSWPSQQQVQRLLPPSYFP